MPSDLLKAHAVWGGTFLALKPIRRLSLGFEMSNGAYTWNTTI